MAADFLLAPSALFEKTARWFDHARAALLDELPCSQGCSHCCVGIFPVTVLDRQEIQRGLRILSSEERQGIVQRAIEQTRLIETSAPQLAHSHFIDGWQDRETDILVEQYRQLPCPGLRTDGSCGVYAFRPLTCRSMGIPQEVDGLVYGACAVQASVPIVRLSQSLRQEDDALMTEEAEQLTRLRDRDGTEGEELLLPYAFVPETGKKPTAAMA